MPDGNSITWSKYNYPTVINGNGESTNLFYDANQARWKQVYQKGSITETTIYVGGQLEKVSVSGVDDYRHYVSANGQAVAIVSRTSAGAITTRYALHDVLGSVAKIADSSGAEVVSESFSAFGAKRNPMTWSGAPTNGDQVAGDGVTRQGYTGQDALGSLGLNHLNGRVQDAVTGRFLSADPYIGEPGNTQNYNRYSYVMNNPLSATDPSGFLEISTGSHIPGADIGFASCYGNCSGFVSAHSRDEISSTNYAYIDSEGKTHDWGTYYRVHNEESMPFGINAVFRGGNQREGGEKSSTRSQETPQKKEPEQKPQTQKPNKPQDPRCKSPLPDGRTVNQNVRDLSTRLGTELHFTGSGMNTFLRWLFAVAPGGSQDYKLSRQPGSEAAGNFNFGATGSLLFGPVTLKSGAGVVQLATLPSNSDGGIPFVSAPYGDSAADQTNIQAGISAGCGPE